MHCGQGYLGQRIHATQPLLAWSEPEDSPSLRFKVFWGVDEGNVIGARRFHAHVGVVLVVHVALARGLAMQPRWEGGSPGQMNLSPMAQALAQLDHDHQPESEPADV